MFENSTKPFRLSKSLVFSLSLIFLFTASAFSQNRFNGGVRNPEQYRDATTGTITVHTRNANGTLANASGLTGCDGVTVSGNVVTPLANRYFCFTGSATSYYIRFNGGSGTPYRWITETGRAQEGVYRLEEFGAVNNTTIDNTYILKNAAAYIGCRPESGGKLLISNAVYKVDTGTKPTVHPKVSVGPDVYFPVSLPIVLPPGISIEGTNGKTNFASSRIQVDINDRTIFKIGGSTDFVTIKDLGLVTPMQGTSPNFQYRTGTKAILASDAYPYSSQHIVFSRLTIQGFEEGISLLGTDSPTYPVWQFDTVRVEDSEIGSCLYPIRINTRNTDWIIANTTINTMNNIGNSIRGVGIWIQRAGVVTLDNVYGGAPKVAGSETNRTLRPEAFLKVSNVDSHASLNIRGSESEETDYSILYEAYNSDGSTNPMYDTERFPLHIEGSVFGDPIAIKANVAFVSVGNTYLSDTVRVLNLAQGGKSNATQIYSYGDSFSGVTHDRKLCAGLNYGLPYPPANPDACRRDFYVYNSPGEANTVVMKTSQRRAGTYDSVGLDKNQVESPLKIMSPPVYTDPLPAGDTTNDKFKYWGYTIKRNTTDGYLDFEGNQKPPEFAWDATSFRFFGNLYPSADALYSLGNNNVRWALIRGVTIVSGDTILSDKKTGKELYKIHEDENFIYFSDYRNDKELMKIDRNGNLYVAGKLFQNAIAEKAAPAAKKKKVIRRKALRKKAR